MTQPSMEINKTQWNISWTGSNNQKYNELIDDSTENAVVVELSSINNNDIKKIASKEDLLEENPSDQILKSASTLTDTWYTRNRGMIYILLAVLCVSCLNISVKVVSKSDERLPVLEMVFIRGVVGSLIAIIMILYENLPYWMGPPDARKLLLLRGMFGFLALTFNFFAVSLLSVGDATIISFFAPVFTGLLGAIFLNEKWEKIDQLAGFFSIIGVIFIARPPFLFGSHARGTDDSLLMPDEVSIPAIIVDSEMDVVLPGNHTGVDNITMLSKRNAVPGAADYSVEADLIRLAGAIMALISASCVASAMIIIRKLNKRANPLHVVFYFHWMLIPFAFLFSPLVPKAMDSASWIIPQKVETWCAVLLGTFFGTASQFLMTKGLQTENAAKAASMNYTQVIFAFTAEWIIWGVAPSTMTIFGAGIIITSMIFVALYKNKTKK